MTDFAFIKGDEKFGKVHEFEGFMTESSKLMEVCLLVPSSLTFEVVSLTLMAS